MMRRVLLAALLSLPAVATLGIVSARCDPDDDAEDCDEGDDCGDGEFKRYDSPCPWYDRGRDALPWYERSNDGVNYWHPQDR